MPLRRAIFVLAVPMVLEMVMESVFAIADIFWVSKLGPEAVAAVGLTESLMTIVYAIAIGLAMGVGAVVARRIGEKDPDAAARAAVQAIFIGVGLSAAVGLTGALLGRPLIALMGGSPAVVAVGGALRAGVAGRQRHGRPAVPDQRRLPRRRRRRHLDADTVAGERDQHRPWDRCSCSAWGRSRASG